MYVVSHLIMQTTPKPVISHASIAGNLYSSKHAQVVKNFLEKKAMHDWAKTTPGVDDSAASLEIV